MDAIYTEVVNLIIVAVVAMIGFATQKFVKFLKSKGVLASLETNKELVKIVVQSVEQAYKHLDGKEKLNVAKLELVKLMNEKHIKISEKEIDTFIESAVKEMNDVIKKEIK